MQTEQQKAEKNRQGFRRYYKENRDEYNAKRRQKYAENKELREKARQRAAQYRAENPKVERKLFRELDGKRVQVFSTGQVAQEMDRTPQMLRNWEKHGILPESVFPDQHRLYTAKQKRMIVRLGETIDKNNGSLVAPPVKKAIAKMHQRW